MTTLTDVVAERFVAAMRESGELSDAQLDALAALLSEDASKLKPDAFVSLFNEPAGGDVK